MRRAWAWLLLPAALALPDVVVLTDGKVLEGRVTETEQGVQILLSNGASTFVPKDRVARIERKPSDVEIFQERREALAPDDLKGRLELAQWAKARAMERAVKNLATEACALDPENAEARALLGQVRAGGAWMGEGEAARRGFAPLARRWGEWDEKYAEEEKALGLTSDLLDRARSALGDPDAMAALGLPSKAWTTLFHRASPEGKPCLLVLDPSQEQTLAAQAGKAAPDAVVVAAPDVEALLKALSESKADMNRVVLVSTEEAAWDLLASRPDLFSSAVLGGAPTEAALPWLVNAQGLDLFLLSSPGESPQAVQRRQGVSALLAAAKGRVFETALDQALPEALQRRRNPRPETVRRRVRARGTFGWVRVDDLAPQGAPRGDFPWLEARVTARNSLFLATRHLKRLTLLLSDDLVDLSKPVTVTVNGVQAFQGPLKADLGMLTESAKAGDPNRLQAVTLPLEIP